MLTQSAESSSAVTHYLSAVSTALLDVPFEERQRLIEQTRARIELELHLAGVEGGSEASADAVLQRLGPPDAVAKQLREELSATETAKAPPVEETRTPIAEGGLVPCRACGGGVSAQAMACPHCGAPYPARRSWKGWGYEWKSRQTLFGWPLVHVAVGRDENNRIRVAKGIIAIGQFGIGAITIAQFGIAAVFGIGQFMLAPLALGQFAFGLVAAGQFGIGLFFGAGQFATGLKAIGMLKFGNWLGR